MLLKWCVFSLCLCASYARAALPASLEAEIDAAGSDGLVLVGLLAVSGAAIYLVARLLSRFGFRVMFSDEWGD